MKKEFHKHLILQSESVRNALSRLNLLAPDLILFVINENGRLLGSLTDGDIRRGFIKGLTFDSPLLEFVQPQPVYIRNGEYTLQELKDYKERNLKIIPITDEQFSVIDILNLRLKTSLLPVDALIMAGGKGQRLQPLTKDCPKPLLKVGDKPIIEHNIDRLARQGVQQIYISINYLGHMIRDYFRDGEEKGIKINYVEESEPMGTIGAARNLRPYDKDALLIMNSDLLTNINFIDFYTSFLNADADMAVAAVGYHVDVPYAVFEMNGDNTVKSLTEKPRYTFYSNAGIYLIKKEVLAYIPDSGPFDVPELMDRVIASGLKLITYPILDYWLDIGRMADFTKAQEDIKHINF